MSVGEETSFCKFFRRGRKLRSWKENKHKLLERKSVKFPLLGSPHTPGPNLVLLDFGKAGGFTPIVGHQLTK